MWSGPIWAARISAEDSWETQERGQQRKFVEGDGAHRARINSSVVDEYPQHVYRAFALDPVIPKRIHRLLNSLGRRSTTPMGSKLEHEVGATTAVLGPNPHFGCRQHRPETNGMRKGRSLRSTWFLQPIPCSQSNLSPTRPSYAQESCRSHPRLASSPVVPRHEDLVMKTDHPIQPTSPDSNVFEMGEELWWDEA